MSEVLLPLILVSLVADVRGCVCDPARPETMEGRECSLTNVATTQPDSPAIFFVKDANPTKPNRWLAIPRHLVHTIQEMDPEERAAYWTAAVSKAHELWGEQWGLAINGEEKRTQCQMHIHIGKLLDEADRSGGELVEGPRDIPVPPEGTGLWIHPEGNKLRVHIGGQVNEPVLMR